MNDINLSVVRAQYGENDGRLWMKPAGTPQHLTNPLTPVEVRILEHLKDSKSVEEFLGKVYGDVPPMAQRRALLAAMRAHGKMLKAQQRRTSRDIRDLKATFVFRWMERMNKVLGIPLPWLERWIRDVGIKNAKGNLAVEFGGDP